jgi:polysaccharide pyruvyl transferase WcaK-like protein
MGINFRNASSYHPDFCDHGYEIIAEALDRIINKHAFHIVFIPVTYDTQDDDRKSAAEVIRYMKHSSHVTNISGVYDGTVIRGLIDRMTLVAGSSYHFLLFALSQTLPTLALTKNEYYRAKHKGLMSLYEQEDHLIHMAEASSEDVVANIENLLYHQNDIRQKLQERQVILESTAQASYAMLKRKF